MKNRAEEEQKVLSILLLYHVVQYHWSSMFNIFDIVKQVAHSILSIVSSFMEQT